MATTDEAFEQVYTITIISIYTFMCTLFCSLRKMKEQILLWLCAVLEENDCSAKNYDV